MSIRIGIVVTLLAYGCPPQAIVHALDLDERTVARWQERAGAHCQKVHRDQVMQAQLDLQHVQADEIRAKGCKMIPWMAMAMMVSTRLWLGGVVSLSRNRSLADQLLQMVKACCLPLSAVLVLTDGWSAYPGSIRRAFREKIPKAGGRGRCALQVWPEILIATVIKKTAKKRVVEVIRRMAQGTIERANELLTSTLGGEGVEYRVYRALQWNDERALGEPDSAVPPHISSSEHARSRDVAGGLHLQLLLATS